MMTDYLSIPSASSSSSTRIVRHPQGTYVNLRSSGSKSARVLVQVPHGATVVVLSAGKTMDEGAIQRVHRVYDDGVFEEAVRRY